MYERTSKESISQCHLRTSIHVQINNHLFAYRFEYRNTSIFILRHAFNWIPVRTHQTRQTIGQCINNDNLMNRNKMHDAINIRII